MRKKFHKLTKEAETKQKSSFFFKNDAFLRIRNWFPFQGRFPRARLQANRTLVRKTLSHDVTILVFLPFREGAKKMDFLLVLFPQESPLHYNQFIKYQIFNMAIYHKQRNLYLCPSLFFTKTTNPPQCRNL